VFRPICQGITILTLVSVGLLIQAIVLMAPLKQAIPTSQSWFWTLRLCVPFPMNRSNTNNRWHTLALGIEQYHWHNDMSCTWVCARIPSLGKSRNPYRHYWTCREVVIAICYQSATFLMIVGQRVDRHRIIVAITFRIQRHDRGWSRSFKTPPRSWRWL
jgi:hypothetical protein